MKESVLNLLGCLPYVENRTPPYHWKQELEKLLVSSPFFSPSARLPVFLVSFSTIFLSLPFACTPSLMTWGLLGRPRESTGNQLYLLI